MNEVRNRGDIFRFWFSFLYLTRHLFTNDLSLVSAHMSELSEQRLIHTTTKVNRLNRQKAAI